MRLLKKINNNFALASDSTGETIIVSGKGVGFIKMPCELNDLSIITRTYYDIDNKYIGLLNEIPEEVLEVSVKVVDYAKKTISSEFNPNLIFTLADHLNFSIDRYKKGIVFDFPLSYDFEHMYAKEIEIGKYALKLISSLLGLQLPKQEVHGIAMNIINAELYSTVADTRQNYNTLVEDITAIIENHFEIKINKDTVNYSRFATHLAYLFGRIKEEKLIKSDNQRIYRSLQVEYPETYECVLKIENYLRAKMEFTLNEEELLYLILHVNRLHTREDCYRKGITPDV